MSGVSIDILHKHGAPRHYTPIEHLCEDNAGEVFYYEYSHLNGASMTLPIIGEITIPRLRDVIKIPSNVFYFARSGLRNTSDVTVLGAEPFDMRVLHFRRIARHNDLVYHTSWPFWNGDRILRDPLLDCQRQWWREFLSDIEAVTVTKAAKDSLAEFGVSATQIPHAVDTSSFSPGATESQRDSATILFVGRLIEKKGLREYLPLVEKLKKRDGLRFEFAGEGPLSHLVRDISEHDSVTHHGYVSDNERLVDVYRNADLLVLPSHRHGVWEELFGIVLIEAMACETPVVATDCVGPSEIIDDGTNGYLIEQHDMDALQTVIEIIASRSSLSERLGEQARRDVVKDYDIATVADQWKEVLNV